ncbi:MAG TPA: peptidylprolyl isomerase [Arenimonas sp.]|nr:peptidylprolyl isomerase [Arenimonas sp.]
MNIDKNTVVKFHYTVTETGKEQLESSKDNDALSVLVGHGAIIPGLEEALMGKQAGDTVQATIAPEQAYGERRDGLTQRIPKKLFKNAKLTPGMQVVLPTEMGPRAMTILKVGMSVVDVDLNHPMAGKSLDFDVEILDVREASAEEIEHGHVHGAGGVEH